MTRTTWKPSCQARNPDRWDGGLAFGATVPYSLLPFLARGPFRRLCSRLSPSAVGMSVNVRVSISSNLGLIEGAVQLVNQRLRMTSSRGAFLWETYKEVLTDRVSGLSIFHHHINSTLKEKPRAETQSHNKNLASTLFFSNTHPILPLLIDTRHTPTPAHRAFPTYQI